MIGSAELLSDNSTPVPRLTIIIPTKDRPNRALAKARTWAKQGCRVLVFDASDVRDPSADSHSEPGVGYHHEPQATMAVRLSQGANLVDTPYAMIQPDDDVFLFGAVDSLVNSMQKTPDAVGASGVAIRVREGNFGRSLVEVFYPQMLERALQTGQTGLSLPDFTRNYYPSVVYGVVRTDVFRAVAKGRENLKSGPYAIGELFFEMGVNGMGKVLALPEVYWIRNPHVPSHDARRLRPPSERSHPWFLDTGSLEYKSFVEELSKVFESGAGLTAGAGSKLARQGIKGYQEFWALLNTVQTKSPRLSPWVNAAIKGINPTRGANALSFLRKFAFSLALASRRRLEVFPQPPLLFTLDAKRAGLKVDRKALKSAIKVMR